LIETGAVTHDRVERYVVQGVPGGGPMTDVMVGALRFCRRDGVDDRASGVVPGIALWCLETLMRYGMELE
jgi:hypothetical protein